MAALSCSLPVQKRMWPRMQRLEFALLHLLRALSNPKMDRFMILVSKLGNVAGIWLALIAALMAVPKWRKTGKTVLYAMVMDVISCNLLLKNLIHRQRPCDVTDQHHINRPIGGSFPSGHTAAGATITSALFFCRSILWFPCAVLTSLIGVSRMYLNVHYPSDIFGAALFGTFFGRMGWKVTHKEKGETE